MTTTFDPKTDFAAVVDRLEAVTLRRPASAAARSVPQALRRAITAEEAEASDGRYATSDVAWHVPAEQGVEPPRLGDLVVDAAGQRWTVLAVERATLDARWRLVTRNLALVHGLNDVICLQRATWTKGAAGALVPVWADELAGVSARIQPERGQVEREHDRRVLRVTHKIFVADSIELTASQRIVDADGAVYQIQSFERPERIDALLTIRASRSPWPEDVARGGQAG